MCRNANVLVLVTIFVCLAYNIPAFMPGFFVHHINHIEHLALILKMAQLII